MDTNDKKSFKAGGYSFTIGILALIAVIVINFFVNQLPASMTKLDTTKVGLHTLSSETKDFVSSIDKDINIYVVCQAGREDSTVKDMLERYQDLSDKLHISKIDPALYPNFQKTYTDAALTDNSLIVESSLRSQVLDYRTFSTSTSFNGEGYLTAAINYVTTDELPVIYALNGNGETGLTDNYNTYIAQSGFEIKDLNLLSEGAVPDDASILLINAPTKDLSTDEASAITKYLENGGHMMLITAYADDIFPNLAKVTANYGAKLVDGMVIEGSAESMLGNYPHYILPTIDSHEITDDFIAVTRYIVSPLSQGIVPTENVRSSIEMKPLLTTSAASYSKPNASQLSSTEKANGDIDGPFDIAVTISEPMDNQETRIVWFTSQLFIDDDIDDIVSGDNSTLLLKSLTWLSDSESESIIGGKEISTEYLTIKTSQARMWNVILIGIIPAAIIILGIIVWYRRKNR